MPIAKVGEDVWLCNPACVMSTLSFKKTETIDSVDSPSCGMGWRFRVTTSTKESGQVPGQTVVRLFLDPQSFIRCLSPRQLKISVIADPGTTIASNYIVSSLHKDSSDLELGTYSQHQNEIIFRITVSFPEELKLEFPVRSFSSTQGTPKNVVDVMYESVNGKEVIDCVFYLYNCSRKGRMSEPRAVYANLALLRGHCSYLDTLLGGDFKEASGTDVSQVPPVSWDYDYDSDSDFDPGEDFDDDIETHTTNPTVDSKSTSDIKVSTPSPENSTIPKVDPPRASAPAARQYITRSMVLKSCAFRTWKALVLYLTTQRITFRKLSSQQSGGRSRNRDSCSPKSMYRLAHMIGMNELKQKAYEAIRSSVSETNVIEELTSSFTARYDEVRKFEIERFLDCDKKKFEVFCQKLSRGDFTAHQLVVVAEVLRMVQERLEKARQPTLDVVPQPTSSLGFAGTTGYEDTKPPEFSVKKAARGKKNAMWGAF
ncbi:hypothetical protein K435DRAFT_959965 [Dendrothele bispora CBS 962.96]|uniref:Uncharacterized protein n=1 Tax=Dendrothele bispora (strain CBS 962.96) TaxID=1314807 RepID=A0A4S8MVS2_DENBC|nr:hypothetical protein K435DRAFT_959965 [Dendrothele bispora CBS 962.96]